MASPVRPSMYEECRRLQLSLQIASKLQQFVQTNNLAQKQRGVNARSQNNGSIYYSQQSVTDVDTAATVYATATPSQYNYTDSPTSRQKPTPPPKRQSISGTTSSNSNSPTQTQVSSPTATQLYRIQAQGEDQINQATDLFNNGHFTQASALLDKLVIKYPEDPNIYVYSLFCHYSLSTMNDMAMGPTVVIHSKETTFISRVVLLISSEQYSSANQTLNTALKEFPDSAALLALSGFVSLLTEEFHKTSQVADKLATKKPPFASFLKKHVQFEQSFKKGLQEYIIDSKGSFEAFKEALNHFPNSPKATIMLVLSAYRSLTKSAGDIAREHLKTLVVGNQVKILHRVIEYHLSDQHNLAHVSSRELSAKDPYQVYFNAYVTSFADGKSFEAISKAKEVLEISPNFFMAHHLLGFMYAQEEHDYVKALHHYDKVLQIQPHSIFTWVNKAKIIVETEGAERAVKLFETALKINPQSKYANEEAAKNLKELGRFSEAIALFEKIELSDRHFVVIYAECYEEQSNFNKALTVVNKYIHKPPMSEDGRLHYEKAWILKNLGQHTSALSSINTAIELERDVAGYYGLKAELLFEKENHQEALKCINQAISKEEKTSFFKTKLRILGKVSGRFEETLETCEKILEDNSSDPFALFQKSFALFKLDRNQEAFEASEELVNAEDDDGDNWALLCLTAAVANEIERSKYAIRKARSLKCSPAMKDIVDKIEKAINENTRSSSSSNNRSNNRSQSSGGRRAVARQDYTRRAADEISLVEDEVLVVLGTTTDNIWTKVRDAQGNEGFAPTRLLQFGNNNSDSDDEAADFLAKLVLLRMILNN